MKYLRNKLKSVEIPDDIILLEKMPLNNNNKLDKLPKKQSKIFNQLEDHPRLKEAFEKISKKISKI